MNFKCYFVITPKFFECLHFEIIKSVYFEPVCKTPYVFFGYSNIGIVLSCKCKCSIHNKPKFDILFYLNWYWYYYKYIAQYIILLHLEICFSIVSSLTIYWLCQCHYYSHFNVYSCLVQVKLEFSHHN